MNNGKATEPETYNGLVPTATRVWLATGRGAEHGLLAYAQVVLNDAMRFSDIKVTVDRECKVRVVMPAKKLDRPTKAGRLTVDLASPVSEAARAWLVRVVLKAYYEALAAQAGDAR